MPDLQTRLKPLPQKPQIASSDQAWKLNEILIPKIWKIENGIHSEAEVGKFEAENQFKLEQLEQERDRLLQIGIRSGLAGIAIFTVFSPSALIWFPSLWKIAEILSALSRRYFLMLELLEAFEDEDVAIEIGLQAEEAREIDLFLRFPDKEFFLIYICSVNQARVNFSLNKQALQFRRKTGGLRTIKPNPIMELLKQERWIRNQRADLLGSSSRDRRRAIAKAVVFWDNPTIAAHPEQMYAIIGDQSYLYATAGNNGSAFIFQRDQTISFIRDFLISKRSRKT